VDETPRDRGLKQPKGTKFNVMKFEKQESPKHEYCLGVDSICGGEEWTKNEDGDIQLFTKEECLEEFEDLYECSYLANWEGNKEEDETKPMTYKEWVIAGSDDYIYDHMDNVIENRKFMFGTDGGFVTGTKPQKA
jgi:hypothetical protein